MASMVESTTLFSEIAIVPLVECKIPTLIVPPLEAAGEELAADVAAGLAEPVAVVVGGVVAGAQALIKELTPRAVEPKIRNLRRFHCVMGIKCLRN